jgi:disulfide bond formation protein DsbB
MIKKLQTQDQLMAQLAIASALALIIVLIFQYIFKFQPCSLCVLQRIPYFLILIISIIGVIKRNLRQIVSCLIVVLLFSEIGLAIYHVGIEHYIFEENYLCQLVTKEVSCNQIMFRFMNLSIAEWNLIYCLGLLYYFIYKGKHDGYFTG